MALTFTRKTSLVRAAVAALRRAGMAARTTMLVGIGGLVSGILACSAVPSPSSSGAGFVASTGAQCGVPASPTPFLRNLRMLAPGYDPTRIPKPAPVGTSPVPDPYCTTLTQAYNAADRTLQNALDDLTNTFISTDACPTSADCSWGYVDKFSGDGTHKYVALSSSLWNSAGTPITYDQFVEQTARALLLQETGRPLSIQPNPDLPGLALIAALAHEVGHIKWWARGVEMSNACHDPVTGGNGKFSTITWDNAVTTPPWRGFGRETLQNINMDSLLIGQLQRDAMTSSAALLRDLLIVYSGRWPSILAIVSPDEDFVETYTLLQVVSAMRKQSPHVSLQVTLLPGSVNARTVDLLSFHDNPTDPGPRHADLHHKLEWIKHCTM